MKKKINKSYLPVYSIKNRFNELMVWLQSVSASELADSIARHLAQKININSDLYDKLIDWNYVTNHVGSSTTHHLTDGAHTIWGAFQKASEAFPDDSVFTEMIQAMEHLGRDLFSVSGINPFVQMTPEQLAAFKEVLANKLHISKSWVNDLLLVNGIELLIAGISSIYLIFRWKQADRDEFLDYAGSMGAASIYAANPLLGLIFLIALARNFHLNKYHKPIRKLIFNKSFYKGAASTTVFFSVSALVGGPVSIGIILAIISTLYTRKLFNMNSEEIKTRLSDMLSDYLFYLQKRIGGNKSGD